MYRCTACQSVVPAHATAHRVPTRVRPRSYTMRAQATPKPQKGKNRRDRKDDKGGRGWEIGGEGLFCSRCAPEAEARFAQLVADMESPAPVAL